MKMYVINQVTGQKHDVTKGTGKNEVYYWKSLNGNRLRPVHKPLVIFEK